MEESTCMAARNLNSMTQPLEKLPKSLSSSRKRKSVVSAAISCSHRNTGSTREGEEAGSSRDTSLL